MKIRNNLFYDPRGNGGNPVDLGTNITNISSDYNCYYQCSMYSGEGPNSFSTDPKLRNYDPNADQWDAHPLAGSSLIDAGDTTGLTLPSPWLDLDGVTRDTVSPDVGAYKYVAAVRHSSRYGHGFRRGILEGFA